MSRFRPEIGGSPVYWVSHALFETLYSICFRGEILGLEHVPASGPYLVVSNHASFLDPPIVGLYLPRQVAFFARKTLWRRGFAAWWLDAVGCIAVDRDGSSDLLAMKRVLAAVAEGRVVILFPEGTRSPDGRLQAPKPGVGLIACRSQATVVPARIFGSFEAFGKGGRISFGTPISVVYGPPLQPSDYDHPADGRERYPRAAERIMAAIARIEPPVERAI